MYCLVTTDEIIVFYLGIWLAVSLLCRVGHVLWPRSFINSYEDSPCFAYENVVRTLRPIRRVHILTFKKTWKWAWSWSRDAFLNSGPVISLKHIKCQICYAS